jgi:hypothetical protein
LNCGGKKDHEVIHARAEAILTTRSRSSPSNAGEGLQKYPGLAGLTRVLFHGEDFHAIEKMMAAPPRIAAHLHSAPPPQMDERSLRTSWLADPLAIDAAQLMICGRTRITTKS